MDIRTIRITENGMPVDMYDSYQYGKHLEVKSGNPGYVICEYAQTITIFYWE